jgi:hypothetical protein
MSNTNGKKFGFTALFPIKSADDAVSLRRYLRSMDSNRYGSPLAGVEIIHMARFVVIDHLAYQGIPAKRDGLKSRYLLFTCDFDGETVDVLTGKLIAGTSETVDEIWTHCVGYPGLEQRDRLTAYFEDCQLTTTLFLADRPDDEVASILRALMYKRGFTEFVESCQRKRPPDLKTAFLQLWQSLAKQPTPPPGSL